MGKKKKTHGETKAIVAEFSVSMHCNACERTVAKAISKLKGVEKFTTDMNNHKVVVIGKIDPQKVLKKLRKKTGKRVAIVVNDNELEAPKDDHGEGYLSQRERDLKAVEICNYYNSINMFDCYCKDSEMLLMMFSDENPNACCVM
ncbi:heavy metal-associated isoprenylated plant protein 19 [Morus notabilis]|uniref:heavy metal-associated isoprenylated plant protein 19 n=1 Tax=Morus notabilis TaxID=981085 RepID=UPI000CED1FF1|nr:heavy metal-associated isoprenylated plant protein 19 [Morus notabilis]